MNEFTEDAITARTSRPRFPSHDSLPEFHMGNISPEVLQATREWLRCVHSNAEQKSPGPPFLVVTPLGMPIKREIAEWLNMHSYSILRRTAIQDWAKTSTALYPRTVDDERLTVALGFEALWRAVCPRMQAEKWELSSQEEIVQLSVEKAVLREQCGHQRFRVQTPMVTFHARLQAIHVPDLDRFALESSIIEAAAQETQHECPQV